MTVRDAGLIALGFLAGFLVACGSMAAVAQNIEENDKLMRALSLKFNAKIKGQG
jgi:hypothetical protein